MAKKKLVIAILQEDDYDTTLSSLIAHHIFVTKLSSSGGFLRKKNITIMIGVEAEQLDTVLQILKECAGHRKEIVYTMAGAAHSAHGAAVQEMLDYVDGLMAMVAILTVTVGATN